MTFAKRVFTIAWIWGALALVPMYFTRAKIGQDYPPAITHPEFYYGFVGVALAWQVLFFVIARDPVRFRPAMAVAVLEKLAFGLPALILFARGELPPPLLLGGIGDLVLGALFFLAHRKTPAQ